MPLAHAQVCRKMTVYAGRRKAGDSKRGKKNPTGGDLRKDATVKSEEVYKINFILFYLFLLAESWDVGC